MLTSCLLCLPETNGSRLTCTWVLSSNCPNDDIRTNNTLKLGTGWQHSPNVLQQSQSSKEMNMSHVPWRAGGSQKLKGTWMPSFAWQTLASALCRHSQWWGVSSCIFQGKRSHYWSAPIRRKSWSLFMWNVPVASTRWSLLCPLEVTGVRALVPLPLSTWDRHLVTLSSLLFLYTENNN